MTKLDDLKANATATATQMHIIQYHASFLITTEVQGAIDKLLDALYPRCSHTMQCPAGSCLIPEESSLTTSDTSRTNKMTV